MIDELYIENACCSLLNIIGESSIADHYNPNLMYQRQLPFSLTSYKVLRRSYQDEPLQIEQEFL
jgi:hypothetical protein